MSEMVGYRCKNCDNAFMIEVLSKDEIKERRRTGQPLGPVVCPRCGSDRVHRVK